MTRRLLTPEQRERFCNAAYEVYNNIGPDSGWIERAPSKAVFVDAISDQLHTQRVLTPDEERLWSELSRAERRRIILEVGP